MIRRKIFRNIRSHSPFKWVALVMSVGRNITLPVLLIVTASDAFAQGGSWTTKAAMPTGRGYLAASVVNGKIYAIGGDPARQANEQYDPVADHWTPKANMPTARFGLATAVVNNIIYAIGGYFGPGTYLDTVQGYDPLSDSWTSKTPMPTKRNYLRAATVNNIIYVIGGEAGPGTGLRTVEAFDPTGNSGTGSWSSKLNMPIARSSFGVGVVDNKIYVIGGVDASQSVALDTVEVYDPALDQWTTKTSMPTPRAHLSVEVVKNKIYAIGGESADGLTYYSTVEEYDPLTDHWTPRASMDSGRTSCGSASVNGIIYLSGGLLPGTGYTTKNQAYAPPGPPTITSFSPTSGPIGTIVNITGTNFNTTPANNIVYFGSVRAVVTSSSSTSLSVTVPVGATFAPITVTDTTTGLTAYTNAPFVVTFPSSRLIDTTSFAAKVDFTTGTGPDIVAIGDLDGDGKPDLVGTNYNSNTVSVYRNTSTSGAITASSFAGKVEFVTGSSPLSVAIGDLDGDGKPDFVVTNYGVNTVSVFRNISASGSITASSFAGKVDFGTGSRPRSVAIGDLDGDGKPDLAVASGNLDTLSILRNTGTAGSITSSSFAPKIDFSTGGIILSSVAIGDLDGDGKPDLVVTNQGSAALSIFRNTSTSGSITTNSFATQVDFTTGTGPYNIVIGDLDGDGKSDLVVANFVSGNVSVFRNTSISGSITSGSFAAKVDFATGVYPYSVAICDLDGDGKPDLTVANNLSSSVSVFRNTSTSGAITASSFAAKVKFTTGSGPDGVAIGDIDGDGKPDLVVANYSSNTVSVLRNTVAPPLSVPVAPTLLSPTNGATNQPTTLTFRWNQSPTATFYRVRVATDSNFVSGIFLDDSTVVDTFKAVSGLTNSTRYYWRVRAKSSGGISSFSSIWSFTTAGATISLHVSTSGNDENPGTAILPLRNIQTALYRASPGDTIKVEMGSYSEKLVTQTAVILRGGYSSSFLGSARDIFNNKTFIMGVSGSSTMLKDSVGSTIDGFIFDGLGFPNDAGIKVYNRSIVAHNVVKGVSSSFDAGIELYGGAVVVNNTVVNCSYGIEIRDGIGTPNVRNNIIAYNSWGMLTYDYSAAVRTYNDVDSNSNSFAYSGFDDVPGIGDISVIPQFKNSSGGDFRLLKGSPCIDAGYPNDPAGEEPAPNNVRIDLGAYGGTKHTAVQASPLAPTLASPVNGALSQLTSLTFRWHPSAAADSYRVQVAIDSLFITGVVIDDSVLVDTFKAVSGLAYGAKYYWRVNARNSGGASAYSTRWNFTTVSSSPTVTTLAATSVTSTSATLNGTVKPNGLTTTAWFEWGTSSTLATYTNTTSQSIGSGSSAVSVTASLTGLSSSMTYYYRTAAQNSVGTRRDSILSLTTISPFPNAPLLNSPSNGATDQSAILTVVTWHPSTTATSYRVQVATDSNFVSGIVLNDSTVVDTFKAVSGLANNTRYYWRVQAKNTVGTSVYSSTWSFTTAMISSVTVTSPNGGETWIAGSVHNVTWESTSITKVKIDYSTNNGTSWNIVIASTAASTRSYSWTVPNTPTTQALVRISDTSNAATNDLSNATFTITPPPSVTVTSPNGGESWDVLSTHNITWTSVSITTVKIEYSTDNGTTWTVVTAGASASTGSYTWIVPNTPTTQALVRISDSTNSATYDQSNAVFTIAQVAAVIVTSPNGGETWIIGSTRNITWLAASITDVKIEFSTNNGTNWITILADTSASIGSYPWRLPNTPTTQALVRLSDTSNSSVYDVSNNVFTIDQFRIDSTSPPDRATNVSRNSTLSVYFNSKIDTGSVRSALSITPSTLGSLGLNDLYFTFFPTNKLSENTTYAVIISTAMRSEGGYPLAAPYTFSFTTAGLTAPATPNLLSPFNGATDQPTTLTLSWRSSVTASSYRVQVATDSNFVSGIVQDDSTVVDTIKNLNSLLNDTKYYWRVNAKNSAGTSTWSATWKFRTVSTPPPVIYSFGAFNLTANSAEIRATVFTDDYVTSAKIQYGLTPSYEIEDTATVNFVANGVFQVIAILGNLVQNTTYHYRVVAYDSSGPGFSRDSTFTTLMKDVTPPTITSISLPTSGTVGVVVTITSSAVDTGSGVASFRLNYRSSGSSWSSGSSTLFSSFTNGTATIPSSAVTASGVDYMLVAVDSAGNADTLNNGTVNYFSVVVSIPSNDPSASFASPTPAARSDVASQVLDFRLLSVPFNLSNPNASSVLSAAGTYENDWRLWEYTGGTSESGWQQQSSTYDIQVTPGKSYFLLTRKVVTLSTGGGQTISSAEWAKNGWQLVDGYNFVGNPLMVDIPVTKLKLSDGSALQAWYYSGSTTNPWTNVNLTLKKYEGLVVKVSGTPKLLFVDPNNPTAEVISSMEVVSKESESRKNSESSWTLDIDVGDNVSRTTLNRIGVRGDATAGFDAKYDYVAPPKFKGLISLSFAHDDWNDAGPYVSDVRPPTNDGYIWDGALETGENREVTIIIHGTKSVPSGLQAYVISTDSRLAFDLLRDSVVKLNSGSGKRHLRFSVGTKEFIESNSSGVQLVPKVFTVHQNYPNPFNPITTIRYELPSFGRVHITLFNIVGQEVQTLVDRDEHEGYHEIFLDGSHLVSGIYYYRLEFTPIDGTKEVGLKKLVMIK